MIALGSAIDHSTAVTYTSALQSYITFCLLHAFPIEPNPDTLGFFTDYMSHHIKPPSVDFYLSGICNQLEPLSPDVREARRHRFVACTLSGCNKLRGTATRRICSLLRSDFAALAPSYNASSSHNNSLFFAVLLNGIFGLMRQGEIVIPNRFDLQYPLEVIMRPSVELLTDGLSFFLPSHKANRFFNGNRVIIQNTNGAENPVPPFTKYLTSRDKLFSFRPQLWLRANGTNPTRNWFLRRLESHFNKTDFSGHSLRAGSATALAEAGVPAHMIQAIRRWASEAFQFYIRHHHVLLAALLCSARST